MYSRFKSNFVYCRNTYGNLTFRSKRQIGRAINLNSNLNKKPRSDENTIITKLNAHHSFARKNLFNFIGDIMQNDQFVDTARRKTDRIHYRTISFRIPLNTFIYARLYIYIVI